MRRQKSLQEYTTLNVCRTGADLAFEGRFVFSLEFLSQRRLVAVCEALPTFAESASGNERLPKCSPGRMGQTKRRKSFGSGTLREPRGWVDVAVAHQRVTGSGVS